MMRYTFWYGGCKQADLDWLGEAVQSLNNNEWKASVPLYFDGSGWGEKVREEAAVTLLNALRNNTSVKSFFLRNAELDMKAQEALHEVFERNNHLESITLKNVRGGGQGALILPLSLFRNSCIQELTLEKCTLNRAGCCELGNMLQISESLTTLSLDNVDPSGDWTALIDAISHSRSLRSLTLKGMRFDDVELEAFLKAVESNQSLVTLHLEALNLQDDQAQLLANVIRHNKHIEEISFRKNNLGGVGVEKIMTDGLCHNVTLRTLFLSHNPIGDEGAAVVVSALQKNSSLERLCLAHCDIWGDGCQVIASGLATMKGLVRLNLDFNDVEYVAPQILLSLRNGNCTLTEVTQRLPLLMKNLLGELDEDMVAMWREIDFYLRWNKAGRRILRTPKYDLLLPNVLTKAADQTGIVYKFLQNSPRALQVDDSKDSLN